LQQIDCLIGPPHPNHSYIFRSWRNTKFKCLESIRRCTYLTSKRQSDQLTFQ
jgi:hypothetical protein